MSSRRRILANRHNATRSTGPRSLAGKAKTRRNALKHGLTVAADPCHLAKELTALLTGVTADQTGGLSARLAHAQSDIIRVRRARLEQLQPALSQPLEPDELVLVAPELLKAALTSAGTETSRYLIGRYLDDVTSTHERERLLLKAAALRLEKLDRYERRAFSRRKFAIRELQADR